MTVQVNKFLRFLPAALVAVTVLAAPFRNGDPQSWEPGRVVRPLFLPPPASNYRLDLAVLGSEWAAIVLCTLLLRRRGIAADSPKP